MNKSNVLLGSLLVFALLLFGCTGSNTNTANGGSTGNSGGNPLLQFAQTFGSKAPAAFSITYSMSLGGSITNQSVFVKPNKFRTDSTYQGVETRVLVTDAVAAVCSKETGEWQCVENPATPEEKQRVFDSTSLSGEQLGQLNKFQITDAQPKTVLGLQAKCFNMSRTDGNETVTGVTCYHPNAFVTLYSELNTSQGQLVQEATAVDLSAPADSVFDLPASLQPVSADNTAGTSEDATGTAD